MLSLEDKVELTKPSVWRDYVYGSLRGATYYGLTEEEYAEFTREYSEYLDKQNEHYTLEKEYV